MTNLKYFMALIVVTVVVLTIYIMNSKDEFLINKETALSKLESCSNKHFNFKGHSFSVSIDDVEGYKFSEANITRHDHHLTYVASENIYIYEEFYLVDSKMNKEQVFDLVEKFLQTQSLRIEKFKNIDSNVEFIGSVKNDSKTAGVVDLQTGEPTEPYRTPNFQIQIQVTTEATNEQCQNLSEFVFEFHEYMDGVITKYNL